ncbi:MAG: hypothetical protein AAGM67_10815, partial [Bacteroidota bacterium]
GQKFETFELFLAGLSSYSLSNGFSTCKRNTKRDKISRYTYLKMTCARFGSYSKRESTIPAHRQRHSASMKCECTFYIIVAKEPGGKGCRITSLNLNHSGECKPGSDQLVNDRKRSGAYTNLKDPQWKQIILLIEQRAPASVLRRVLRTILPARVPITAQILVNVRLKAKKIICANARNGDESLWTQQMALPSGLDDIVEDINGEAEIEARSILRETLSNSPSGWRLLAYLKNLKRADPNFDFRVAYDKETKESFGKQEICAGPSNNLVTYFFSFV